MSKKTAALLLAALVLCSACRFQAPQQKPGENPQNDPKTNLINEINQDARQFAGTVGIYAKSLNTGNTVAINADQIFPTASTHKLVVALAVYKYLYAEASPEKKKKYDIMIRDMMKVSDNPAFFALIEEIEAAKPYALTQVLSDLNLRKTRIHSREAFKTYRYHSVTTPYEMAVVFETIYKEQYLGPEFSAILKEELAKTIFRDEIPRFMTNNKVMHKVGQLPGVLCDTGIVDDGREQILLSVFTTTDKPPPYASDFIARISAKIYNALRTQQ